MARATEELVRALRITAARLAGGADYRWTHLGMCNCGHLAVTLTRQSPAELRAAALERNGDWGELAREYCPTSGYPIDHVIGTMIELGLERDDIRHLERLSAPEVLRAIPLERRLQLSYRERADVVLYLEIWADLLAARLSARVSSDGRVDRDLAEAV